MVISQKKIKEFQQYIFDWWEIHKRDLPWRHTTDPYCIMVSEIMLQQTQVSRVMTKYIEFLMTYPTISALARAKTSDVLRLWKGMGYNRRALYIHQAAKIISDTYINTFPSSEQQLSKLPGIGKYTARAIMVFAYKKDVAMVDTNIRKIITHFFFHDVKQSEKVIQNTADQLVPKGKSWEWHQALMDYGALSNLKVHHPERILSLSKESRRVERKITVPFHQSNRYFRGRIMDLLREKSWDIDELVGNEEKMHKRSKEFFIEIIQGLQKDGLVECSSTTIGLPQ